MGWLRRLLGAERGSIAVMGALSLVGMVGMSSLAVEVGQGYAAKVRNQRIADIAALGAAAAYGAANCSSVITCTAASATASDIAVANGLSSTAATVSGVTVGSATGLKVAVQTSQPVRIGQILGAGTSYWVSTAAVASVSGSGNTACVTVLGSSGNTVSVDGGASLTASGCAITSNGTIYSSNSSAKVTAKQITANDISDSAASWGGNAITTTPTANNIKKQSNAATDSIKGSTAVQTALCYVNKLTGNSDTDYSGGNTSCTTQLVAASAPASNGSLIDWTADWNPKSAIGFNQYTNGSCNYTVPAGTYTIRDLTIGGGCSVSFASGSTLSFRNVNMSGATMTVGDGNVTISGTFTVNANDPITMGNGNHSFGVLTINGGKKLSLGTGNLLIGGAISVSGGAYLKANIASGNSVTIGNDGSGTAISEGGGSWVCFTSDCSAPTAVGGTFSANGSITTSGGSTMVFPIAQTHVIAGDINLNGSSIFGAGLYVVKGNFTNNTGGTMTGSSVTFALGGTFTLSGGTTLDLSAPTTASGYGVPDLLIATKSSSATSIGGGSQDKYGGLIYAPNSAMSASGGSSVSANGSSCMMLVVKSITLTGSGTINTSNCSSMATNSNSTPALIQ